MEQLTVRYFLDTEFIDDGSTIALISIGVVRDNGEEYYAQLTDGWDEANASEWVKEHVISELVACPSGGEECDHSFGRCFHPGCPWRSRAEVRQDLERFIYDPGGAYRVAIHSWCGAYDWVAVCQLWGTMMQLPRHFPHYLRDIQQTLDERGIPDCDLPEMAGVAHNALSDARHIKAIHEWLQSPQGAE